MVVCWHKLDEVENEFTSHNLILFAIFVLKFSQLQEIWQSSDKNNFAQFFETRCMYTREVQKYKFVCKAIMLSTSSLQQSVIHSDGKTENNLV